MPFRSVALPVTAALALLLRPATLAAQEPDAPAGDEGVYVAEGACPFECCQYGRWWALADVPVRREPRSGSEVVAIVEAGDTVHAVTGQVRAVPTPFVWKEATTGEQGRRYEPGDTVEALVYLGEGYWRVRWRGKEYDESLGFSPYGGTGGTRCEECRWGEALREHRAAWWARIELDDGTVGWTDATESFGGKDACGW